MQIRVSVRNFVEFLLRSGDIDRRRGAAGMENAMAEGSRVHRMLQKRMGSQYRAEVPLSYHYDTGRYEIVVEGRADGLFPEEDCMTVDEIKGTYRSLHRLREASPVHLAQAKCYAFFYWNSLEEKPRAMRVRMTYCSLDTEEVKYFYEEYTGEQLREWFEELLAQYQKWADFSFSWRLLRQESIRRIQFPFPYRDGQRELAAAVYHTISRRRRLYLEAPTGAGKTITTLFPAIKAMGEELCEKVFYLTAKTIARTVAADAVALLRGQGLRLKSVELTAREKICFLDAPDCTPERCPHAKGHFDRINGALYDLLTSADSFDRTAVEACAQKHRVCPFELSLDLSLFADVVLCDYNYVFDPHAYLRRFFGEGNRGEYLFLIDEAHNLVERGREMYSAELKKEEFLTLRRTLRGKDRRIVRGLEKCNRELLALRRTCEQPGWYRAEGIDPFVTALRRLHAAMEQFLENQDRVEREARRAEAETDGAESTDAETVLPGAEAGIMEEAVFAETGEAAASFAGLLTGAESPDAEAPLPGAEAASLREAVLDFYFAVSHFLDIYERVDEHYVTYTRLGEDGSFALRLFCVNPRVNLQECMNRGRSSILFSATLLPIQYYKNLLGGEAEDYEMYAQSVFDHRKRLLLIGRDVTSRYARRGEQEYVRIAAYIQAIVEKRNGNYLIFFPSYAFLREVLERYRTQFQTEQQEWIAQQERMSEAEREAFLGRFQAGAQEAESRSLLGFCVLGGIFSEGIDLSNDQLIGAVIVGTGLPQVCEEREILKQYFDGRGENGFDYAYRYPGMNKVLQAAGRVIRTAEDVGVVALLDERFLQERQRRLFPREWEAYEVTEQAGAGRLVERFWDEWL